MSLLAYIGGDDLLLAAHMDAVRTTLSWTEKTSAGARVNKGRGQEVVGTGNLLVALFQHDTSRSLDPQAHIHAVVVNATKAPDGKWRALAEYALWQGKTTIASVYNRSLVGALFTRGREQVTFVVDNLTSFERRARENAGEKASALEIAGQSVKRRPPGISDPPPPHRSVKIIWPERDPAPEQYNVPLPERERDMDWGR